MTVNPQPFFSPTASWNQPASKYGKANQTYNEYVQRLLRYGGGSDPAAQKIQLLFKEYSIPIYDRAEANTTTKIFQSNWAYSQQSFASNIGDVIPWNFNWKQAPGNDQSMIIVDYAKGEAWECWGVESSTWNGMWVWPNIAAGIWGGGNKVVMAACNHYTGLWTQGDGVASLGRGMGTHKLCAGPIRAAEVASGKIGHAVSLLMAKPMFGPLANPPVGNTGPGAGYTTGFYCKPATRLEHVNPVTLSYGGLNMGSTDADRAKSCPSGMRFALNITDAEIDAWLNSRGLQGALRNTAKIIAVALRDYGMIIGDTCGWGMLIEVDGMINPQSKAQWATLGVVDDGTAQPYANLLDGLITEQRLYVVAQP